MWSYCEELMIVLQIRLNWNSVFESSCCPSLMQFLWTWIYSVFSHSHMISPSALLVWRNSFDVFYQFYCPNVMTIALADLTVIIKNSQISPNLISLLPIWRSRFCDYGSCCIAFCQNNMVLQYDITSTCFF